MNMSVSDAFMMAWNFELNVETLQVTLWWG